MPIAFVQEVAANVTSSGSPQSAALSFPGNVTAGSTLIVYIGFINSATRTWTVTDNIVGSTGWTLAKEQVGTGPRYCQIWYRTNHPGGAVTITAAHNQATQAFLAGAAEFSTGSVSVSLDATDGKEDSGATNNHTCSTSGVTSANYVLAVCSGLMTSTTGVTSLAVGTSYTRVNAAATQLAFLFQWRIFPTGCTAETGAWTSAGTARVGDGAIALFGVPIATTPIPVFMNTYRQRRV